LPITTLDAERFAITVAPASAANEDGGVGTHRSSQISTCRTKPLNPERRNNRSVPNGAVCPASRISLRRAVSPGVN
jgi:hypothetical protein